MLEFQNKLMESKFKEESYFPIRFVEIIWKIEIDPQRENSLQIKVINYSTFQIFQGQITEEECQQKTHGLYNTHNLYYFIQNNIANILESQNVLTLDLAKAKLFINIEFTDKYQVGNKQFIISTEILLEAKDMDWNEKFNSIMKLNQKEKREQQEHTNQLILQHQKTQDEKILKKIIKVKQSFKKKIRKMKILLDQLNEANQNLLVILNEAKLKLQNPSKEDWSMLVIENLNYYLSNSSDQHRQLEFQLKDDDIQFSFGIIMDGNIQNIQSTRKSYQIILPERRLYNGQNDEGLIVTHKLQLDDKVTLKIDTQKHFMQLAINDYNLTPINISQEIQNYSFFIQSKQTLEKFAELEFS